MLKLIGQTGTLPVPGTPSRDTGPPGPVLKLGPELAHLSAGDIIHVPAGARRVTVLWKNSARHNALLLAEQCDNYCLMCSQPPTAQQLTREVSGEGAGFAAIWGPVH